MQLALRYDWVDRSDNWYRRKHRRTQAHRDHRMFRAASLTMVHRRPQRWRPRCHIARNARWQHGQHAHEQHELTQPTHAAPYRLSGRRSTVSVLRSPEIRAWPVTGDLPCITFAHAPGPMTCCGTAWPSVLSQCSTWAPVSSHPTFGITNYTAKEGPLLLYRNLLRLRILKWKNVATCSCQTTHAEKHGPCQSL